MGGFILECLAGQTWRRDGVTYWTRDDAEQQAKRILRRGKATEVRVLSVRVSARPVVTLGNDTHPARASASGKAVADA